MKNVEAPTATQAKKKKKNPRVHIDQTVSTCTHSDSKSDKQQQARKRIKKKTNLRSNEPDTVLSDEQVEITSKRRNKKPLREPIARKKATKQHSSKSPEQGRPKDQPIQKQQQAKKDVRADTSQRRHDVITIVDEEELNSRNQLNHKVEDPDANRNQVETEQPLPLQQQQSQSRERVQQVEPSHWRHSPEKENTKPRGNESQALQKVENQEDDEDRVDVELQPVTQLPMENDSDDQIDAIENPDNNGFEDTSNSQDDTVAPPATQLSAGDSESDDHSNALDNQVTQKAKTDIEEGKKDEPQEQAEETLWKDSLVVSVSSKPDISLWKTIGDRSFTSFHLDGQLITMSFMDFLNEEALVCQKLLGGALPEQVGITSNKSFTRFLTWLLQSD